MKPFREVRTKVAQYPFPSQSIYVTVKYIPINDPKVRIYTTNKNSLKSLYLLRMIDKIKPPVIPKPL